MDVIGCSPRVASEDARAAVTEDVRASVIGRYCARMTLEEFVLGVEVSTGQGRRTRR